MCYIFLVRIIVCVRACQATSVVWLFATRWTVARQDPLSMGFSRQEYWSGLLFPSPGDLPDPGTEPRFLALRQILYYLGHLRSSYGPFYFKGKDTRPRPFSPLVNVTLLDLVEMCPVHTGSSPQERLLNSEARAHLPGERTPDPLPTEALRATPAGWLRFLVHYPSDCYSSLPPSHHLSGQSCEICSWILPSWPITP